MTKQSQQIVNKAWTSPTSFGKRALVNGLHLADHVSGRSQDGRRADQAVYNTSPIVPAKFGCEEPVKAIIGCEQPTVEDTVCAPPVFLGADKHEAAKET